MRPSQSQSHNSRHGTDPIPQMPPDASLTASGSRRRMRAEESWIEVSSQASASASLQTSLADNNTRLSNDRIPRPLVPVRCVTETPRSASTGGSSQDEYEESSSESDRVMSSSNEDLSHNNAASDDDDDNRTALGTRPTQPFTPQPNAFSHPPANRPTQDSYFPRVISAPNSHLHNRPPRSRPHLQRERERTGMAASYQHQHDHDAALRASLTTLLSCAAAVRPKPQHSPSAGSAENKDKAPVDRPTLTRPSNQPTTMRLIPESQLNNPITSTNRSAPSDPSGKPVKRRSRSSSKDRQSKKMKAQQSKISANAAYSYDDYLISPTVASWVISAGMVLVFSAISFSAGYAWGREVGRIEGEMGLSGSGIGGGAGGSCSKEALRSGVHGGVRGWGRASVVQ